MGIFVITIQDFCTDAELGEGATKKTPMGDRDDPLVQSCPAGALRAHGGWTVAPAPGSASRRACSLRLGATPI